MDNAISITVGPLALSPLMLYYITAEDRYYIMFLYAIVIALVTELFKRAIVRYSDSPVWKRPMGARDCGICNDDGDSAGDPGFPSGHVALATFLACAYSHNTNIMLQLLGVSYVGCVSYARIRKHCHSLFQVAGGACVGILAYILFDAGGEPSALPFCQA